MPSATWQWTSIHTRQVTNRPKEEFYPSQAWWRSETICFLVVHWWPQNSWLPQKIPLQHAWQSPRDHIDSILLQLIPHFLNVPSPSMATYSWRGSEKGMAGILSEVTTISVFSEGISRHFLIHSCPGWEGDGCDVEDNRPEHLPYLSRHSVSLSI